MLTAHDYARLPKDVSFERIQELRQHFGDDLVSALLGIHKFGLSYRTQRLPSVRRLAFLLHRLTFRPTDPVSLFDILTCGKYDRTPQEKPAQFLDWEI